MAETNVADQGISIFPIYRADATYDTKNDALTINLYYPRSPKEQATRLPGNSEFGAKTLRTLLKTGYAEIATSEVPIKPCDGGSMWVFNDGVFLVHRRLFPRGKNKVHNYYHGAPGGYTESLNATFSKEGLTRTMLKESVEENILVTREKHPHLLIPSDSAEYALQAVKNLGLDKLPIEYFDVTSGSSNDILNVFREDEQLFSCANEGLLDLMWDNSTSLSMMQLRYVPLSSKDILPIDAEGMIGGDGKFIHFNRESYLIPIKEVANKKFGTPLENFEVFQTEIKDGIPHIAPVRYEAPFYGPDEKEVTHPHLWAPENHTTVCLDALGVPGYSGKRFDIQLWKEQCALSGESMIPDEFLVKAK